MTSPESTKAAPKSPAVQDSPVSSYLSSLSPLKPIDARPSMHLYGDASCPTPELVFTSPHLSRQPSLLKRSLLSGAEKFSSGYNDKAAAFAETGVVTPLSSQMVKLVPCVMNTCNVDGPLQDHPCGSPSTCVDAFLADPSENSDNPSGLPDPHLKQAAELTQGMQGEHISADENQTKCHNEDLVQAQRHTSSVHVTGSVADTLKHSTSSALLDLNSSQPIDLPQGFCNYSNSIGETFTEHQVPHVKTCINTDAAVNSCSSYQAEEDPAGEDKFLIVDLGENEGSVKIDERSLDVHLRPVFENVSVNADSFKVPTSGAQLEQSPLDQDVTEYPSSLSKSSDVNQVKENPSNTSLYSHGTKDSKVHCADSVQLCELDCAPHSQPGPLQNIQAGDIHLDESGEISNISIDENYISYDQEEGAQYQRAMRKRLQFEAVENCRTSSGYQTNSRIFASDVSNLESHMTSMEMETVNASNKESIPTSSNKQLIQPVSGNALCSLSHEVGSRGRNKESLPVMVPRPFGIGLHLNSIGSAGPVSVSASMQLPGKDVGVEGEKLLSGGTDQVLQYPNNFLTSMSLTGHHSAELCASSDDFSPYSATVNSEGGEQGNHAIKVPNYSASYQSSLDVRPLRSTPQLKEIDRYMTPCSMKRPLPEDASRTVSTEKSPRRKRQMKKTPEKEGCKRCNCKRSKCLKLYCDCFAARVFCSETCSCQGCYNKPEHEDTIRETRQQIESRNPLAFAPKVVVRVTNSAKDAAIRHEMERQTPTSARHKRGCNCKKSLCLKKYCECFQAGVGCSLGCRCDGCKNTFGRKDGCDEITEMVHKKYEEIDLERDPSVGKLGGMEVKRGSVNTEHCYSRLSPLTPLFHASNGTGVPEPQLRAKFYPSPESRASVSPSYEESPSSPIDSISSNPFAKETGGASSLVPFRQDLGCQVDPFSPGWDGFPDICNLSPLPNPSPHDSGTSAGSKARAPRVLHAKLFRGSGRLSAGSLRWRSSPVTPLPHLGESKFVMEPDSDSGLNNNHEDDTPEILKDTSSPIKAVTASSPNQKRVSPPHQHIQDIRSSSSPGLRSGRKFILQSVPSFPPLTPYSNNTSRELGK